MKKISLLLFALILPLFAIEKTEHLKLQLKWKHQFQFAGFYAAVEKGFYKEAGLKVELIEGGPDRRPIDRVMDKSVNFGIGNSEILLHRLEGKPIQAIGVIFQHSPSVFLSKKSSNILSPQDMMGKRVMMREGIDSIELLAVLQNEGIDISSIAKQDITYNIDDLIHDKTDVYHAYISDQPFFLQQRGVEISIIRPISYGIDFYGDTMFAHEDEITDHPERTKRFRAASLKGWEYAMNNPDEIIELILTKYKPNKTRDHLEFEAETMRSLLTYEAKTMEKLLHPHLIEIGHMNPGRWRHIAETFVQLGMLQPGYSLDGFLYDPNPEKDFTWVKWVVGIALGLAVLFGLTSLVIYSFNKKLKRLVDKKTAELLKANQQLEEHQSTLEDKITERTRDLEHSNFELRKALEEVKTLTGLLPICASCKKIRDDNGYWQQIEGYIKEHSDAEFSHGICPDCKAKLYPDYK